MRCETNLKAAADLADCLTPGNRELVIDESKRLGGIGEELVILATAEDTATSDPDVRRKARTPDWKTQS